MGALQKLDSIVIEDSLSLSQGEIDSRANHIAKQMGAEHGWIEALAKLQSKARSGETGPMVYSYDILGQAHSEPSQKDNSSARELGTPSSDRAAAQSL